MQTPLLPNSVMELALKFGYFAREHVDVRLVRVQQTPLAVAALMSGSSDMANISLDALITLTGRGQDNFKAIGSPNKAFHFLIAAKDTIANVASLRGKSFGVGRVGSLDYALSSEVLGAKGLPPREVNMISLGQPRIRLKALAGGKIDATTTSIGGWIALPNKAGLHVLVSDHDYFAAAPVVAKLNVVPDQVLRSKRQQVERITAALIKASRDFAANPDKWVDAMVTARPDISRADLARIAQTFASDWSVNGGLNRRELDFSVDWLYRHGNMKALPDVTRAQWLDTSVVDAVLAKIGIDKGGDRPDRTPRD